MKNFLRQGFAKRAILFAFLIGIVSPSAMAYVDGGYPAGTGPVAAIAPSVQNLNVSTASGSATVSFSLNTNATTTVWIKDSTDTIVRTLAFDNNLSGGTVYTYNWNGNDNNGSAVASGTYKAQVVAYNSVSSDIENYTFSFNAGSTVTAPSVTVSVSPTSFDPTMGQTTTVNYTLSSQASLRVEVKLGSATVKTLRAQSLQSPGSYSLVWDGRNDAGTTMGVNAYTVEVYASNTAGSDTDTATVNIVSSTPTVTAPNITNLYATPTPFNPNNENTRVYFNLDKSATVTVTIMDGSSTVRTLTSGTSLSAGTYFYEWNGRDSNGNIVSDKVYTARVMASNSAGSDTENTSVEVKTSSTSNAPNITNLYATPTPFNPNNENTRVYFTLDKSATTTVTIMDGSSTVRTLTSGTSLSAGTYFYEWNGRDSNGNIVSDKVYTARVVASNSSGSDTENTSVEVRTSGTGGSCDLVTSHFVNPTSFDPSDRDAQIYYNLSRTAEVTVKIKKSGTTVRTLINNQSQTSGQRIVSWNGRDLDGDIVSNGTYTYEVRTFVNGCAEDIATGSVTVTDGNDDDDDYINDWPSTDENLIKNLMVNPDVFDPTEGDRSTVSFDLTRRAELYVQVLDGNTVVKTLRHSDSQAAGDYSYTWDGRDSDGDLMPDDVYVFRVMADDGDDTDTDRGYVELDTDGILIGFPDNARCAGFRDVSIYSPFCKAIELMSKKRIFDGYSDGTFRPYEKINRAETAKVVVLALGYEVDLGGYFGRQYNDTIANAWYAPYLEVAKRNNIATGYPDGSFRPASTINRVELLRVFLEANNLNLSSCSPQPFEDTPINRDTDWYMKYACYAKHNGLMNSEFSNKLFPAEPMTRGDVADLFYDFEVKGLFAQYGNTNNFGERVCVDYDQYGDCDRYEYADNGSYTTNNYYNSYTTYDNNDGYYVYRDGRYVWVAY